MNIEQSPYQNLIFLKQVLVWCFAFGNSMITAEDIDIKIILTKEKCL